MKHLFSYDNKREFSAKVKKWLLRVAKRKCEICGNPQQQFGHKKSLKHGGKSIKSNAVLLCYDCNTKQGTQLLWTYLEKNRIEPKSPRIKKVLKERETEKVLKGLHLWQLNSLAKKRHKKVKGSPTITHYAHLLAYLKHPFTEAEINAVRKERPPIKKKKRRRRSIWSL